jgi:hypothetical protein
MQGARRRDLGFAREKTPKNQSEPRGKWGASIETACYPLYYLCNEAKIARQKWKRARGGAGNFANFTRNSYSNRIIK